MDGSGKIEPLVTTPGNYSWPGFSPDGKRLALVVDTGKGQEIFVYDRQRDAMSRLTFAGGVIVSPVWSRDGEHLVFESNGAAGPRLNWIRADGSGEVQVLLESKDGIVPSGFSPDGRRLAYHEGNFADMDLWTLPLDTSDPEHPKPGKPVPFLRTPRSRHCWSSLPTAATLPISRMSQEGTRFTCGQLRGRTANRGRGNGRSRPTAGRFRNGRPTAASFSIEA